MQVTTHSGKTASLGQCDVTEIMVKKIPDCMRLILHCEVLHMFTSCNDAATNMVNEMTNVMDICR